MTPPAPEARDSTPATHGSRLSVDIVVASHEIRKAGWRPRGCIPQNESNVENAIPLLALPVAVAVGAGRNWRRGSPGRWIQVRRSWSASRTVTNDSDRARGDNSSESSHGGLC